MKNELLVWVGVIVGVSVGVLVTEAVTVGVNDIVGVSVGVIDGVGVGVLVIVKHSTQEMSYTILKSITSEVGVSPSVHLIVTLKVFPIISTTHEDTSPKLSIIFCTVCAHKLSAG